jgi:hypothetical protein
MFVIFLSNIPKNFDELRLKNILKFNSFVSSSKTTGLISYNDNEQYQSVINQGIFVWSIIIVFLLFYRLVKTIVLELQ